MKIATSFVNQFLHFFSSLKQKIIISILALFICANSSAQAIKSIQNRWKSNEYISATSSGSLGSSVGAPGTLGNSWEFIQVPNSKFFLLKSRLNNLYIHNQNGPLELGAIQPGWYSAMWEIEPADGVFFKIKNRWKSTYLNIESGKLEAGSIQPGWLSAMWSVGTGAVTTNPGTAAAPSTATNSADWMGNNAGILGPKKFNTIKLPGTHDAGTYGVIDTWNNIGSDTWAPDTDDKKRGVSMGGSGYTRWAKAQEKTIYQQLTDGIRYLDIRVAADKSNNLRICHGLYGPYLQSILNDVKRFVNEHPKEIIIFDINHLFDWSLKTSQGEENNAESYGFRNEMFDALTNMIQSTIGSNCIPSNLQANNTLNELWKSGRQVIVLYSSAISSTIIRINSPAFEQQYIWRGTGQIEDSYKDGVNEDKAAKLTQLASRVASRNANSQNFFVLTGQITPSFDVYGKSFDPTGTYPHGLENLAKQTNPVLMSWINNGTLPSTYLNIIQVDYYNQTCVVELCKKLNGIPSNMAGCNMGPTNWGNWKLGAEIAIDWVEKAGLSAVNWTKGAAASTKTWFEELWNGAVVTQPNAGTRIDKAALPDDVAEYTITFVSMTCNESPDLADGNELEMFGSIELLPSGSIYMSKDANKYLWNTRPGDRVSISEEDGDANHKVAFGTAKYLYVKKADIPTSGFTVICHTMEHDEGSKNDDMKGSFRINLANPATIYNLAVKNGDGDQKVTIGFHIVRTR